MNGATKLNQQTEPSTDKGPTNVDWAFAGLSLVAVLASSIVIGLTLGKNGLADLDTCWLLAAGRGIVQLHGLPLTDPFSYTFETLHRPFVMHSWLSAIIFYVIYSVTGFNGLILMCTVLLSTAFTFLPLNFAGRTLRNPALTYLLIALAPVASIVRFFARPEIFSYVFISLWFIMLNDMKTRANKSDLPWKYIIAFAIIMMFWVNLHSGFALGIAILLYFNVENAVVYFVDSKAKKIPFDFAPLIAMVVSLPAMLINPYGVNLITYNVGMFNSPSKAVITEMMPIAPEHLASSALWPFLLFLALSFANGLRLMSQENEKNEKNEQTNKPQIIQRYFSIALMVASVVVAFSSRRFVSFCVLTLVYQLIALNIKKSPCTEKEEHSLSTGMESCLRIFRLRSVKIQLSIAALAVITTSIYVAYNPLVMPQTISGFTPPFAALDYIQKKQPAGNLYNDPFFGSMLIWYKPRAPKVFIDTRFDMYEFDFLSKFGEAVLGHEYQSLFERYKIDWVFVKPFAPLVQILGQDSGWKETFRDDTAVIFERKPPVKRPPQ